MLTKNVHRSLRALALSLLLCSAGVWSQAQTPQPTPPVSPTQQDATRPPGTQTNQPIPEQVRPVTTDPTAPPGSQRPAPQAPPGTSGAMQSGTPVSPGVTPVPTTTDSLLPVTIPDATTPADATSTQSNSAPGEEPREPVFPSSEPRGLKRLERKSARRERKRVKLVNGAVVKGGYNLRRCLFGQSVADLD